MYYSYLSACCVAIVFQTSFLHGEERAVLNARSMAYVLQADQLDHSREKSVQKLASCNRDLIVIDYAFNSDEDGKWSTDEIESIRKGKRNRKVIAYISIGEAENYRPYWNKEWDSNNDGKPDRGAPPFLSTLNPDWEGNYKVRYWDKSWQKIILKYINEIQEQGFDGIYLDIVDAFEFYEYDAQNDEWVDDRKNLATGNTYRQDMVAWVRKITLHARKRKSHFLIIPQNATQLLTEASYVKSIDALGVEDLFTNGNKKQKRDHINNKTELLKNIFQVGKPVFLIEYGQKQNIRKFSTEKATSNNLKLLLTNRKLSILGTAYD